MVLSEPRSTARSRSGSTPLHSPALRCLSNSVLGPGSLQGSLPVTVTVTVTDPTRLSKPGWRHDGAGALRPVRRSPRPISRPRRQPRATISSGDERRRRPEPSAPASGTGCRQAPAAIQPVATAGGPHLRSCRVTPTGMAKTAQAGRGVGMQDAARVRTSFRPKLATTPGLEGRGSPLRPHQRFPIVLRAPCPADGPSASPKEEPAPDRRDTGSTGRQLPCC